MGCSYPGMTFFMHLAVVHLVLGMPGYLESTDRFSIRVLSMFPFGETIGAIDYFIDHPGHIQNADFMYYLRGWLQRAFHDTGDRSGYLRPAASRSVVEYLIGDSSPVSFYDRCDDQRSNIFLRSPSDLLYPCSNPDSVGEGRHRHLLARGVASFLWSICNWALDILTTGARRIGQRLACPPIRPQLRFAVSFT